MRRSDDISRERIEDCLIKCAELVDQHGDELLPLLERLEAMHDAHKAKESAADRIKRKLGK